MTAVSWRKVLIIAKREYLAVVKRLSFLITAFGLPLLIAVPAGIVGLVSLYEFGARGETRIGLVDEAGLLSREYLEAAAGTPDSALDEILEKLPGLDKKLERAKRLAPRLGFDFYPDGRQAEAALRRELIKGFYLIPADYLESGRIYFYSLGNGVTDPGEEIARARLRRALIASLLKGKVSDQIAARIERPMTVQTMRLDRTGKFAPRDPWHNAAVYVLPIGFSILLMISVFMSAGYLLQGVVAEKGSRVMELLISSASPIELMLGKLIGLGSAGLTQVAIWSLFGLAPALAVLSQLSGALEFSWGQFALSIVYFLLGYLLYGSLMLGIGSIGETQQDSQQLAGMISFVAALPFVLLGAILPNPNGMIAQALSFFPLTSANIMILRMAIGRVGWQDIAASLIILAASIYLALGLSARIFRVGVLLYGKRPTLRDIGRYIRMS